MTVTELRRLDAEIAEKVMELTLLGEANCEHDPECGGLEIIPLYEPLVGATTVEPVFLRECRCEDYPIRHVEYPPETKHMEIEANERNIREHNADLARWGHARACLEIVPPYSSDISAAIKVEDRIAELGLTSVYVQNLWGFAAEAATRDGRVVSQFDIVHASAEQRCRTALKAIENEKT